MNTWELILIDMYIYLVSIGRFMMGFWDIMVMHGVFLISFLGTNLFDVIMFCVLWVIHLLGKINWGLKSRIRNIRIYMHPQCMYL